METEITKEALPAYKTEDPNAVKSIPWIIKEKSSSYFVTEEGESWQPIGHNDAMSWPNLIDIFTNPDMTRANDYLRMLSAKGVTCLRMMMDNCDLPGYMLEERVGELNQRVVFFWDNMIRLCEKYNIRLLLTPFDTFWMWLHWDEHPYNSKNGGPCEVREHFITNHEVLKAVEKRFEMTIKRWGASGAIFAWDLWNEVHPAYSREDFKYFRLYLREISKFVRKKETQLFGKTHLQTASVFGPLIMDGSESREIKELEMYSGMTHAIYKSEFLDFATVHTYDQGTLDDPKNTLDAAISMGLLTERAIEQIEDFRPYLDTEHGPIHAFKDKGITFGQDFDEEYFRFTQWAHFASGGAGGGMRWPNRHPHVLTKGMYEAQSSLSKFCRLVYWHNFKRKNISRRIKAALISIETFGCSGGDQIVVWMIRKNTLGEDGMLRFAEPGKTEISISGVPSGQYEVIAWDTERGEIIKKIKAKSNKKRDLVFDTPAFIKDLALYIRKTAKNPNK